MFSLQYLVQRGLEELSCGCFYEVGECTEWPSEGNDPTAYWDWWSMMPLCHAGLHLLYPLTINTSLISEYKEDVKVMSRKHLSSYNEPSFLLLHFTLINGMFGCSGDRLVVLSYWCLIGLLILRPRWCLRRFFMFSKQLQNGISGV